MARSEVRIPSPAGPEMGSNQIGVTSHAAADTVAGATRFPRHAVVAGVLSGLLFLGGVLSVTGPVAKDTAAQAAGALAGGRTWGLVAVYGAGLGAMFGIWTLSALRGWLAQIATDGGEQLAAASFAGALLAIGLSLTGMALTYGARFRLAGHGGSGALLGLVDAANAAMMLSKFALAVFVAAVSIATMRAGWFPRWFWRLGAFTVISLLASSTGLFTEDSVTQFGGPLDLAGTAPAAVWGLLFMMALLRGPRREAVR